MSKANAKVVFLICKLLEADSGKRKKEIDPLGYIIRRRRKGGRRRGN
jgi:hypothetical protein